MRYIFTMIALLALTACETKEVTHEVGYKGKARVNPWLAAERFTRELGDDVDSRIAWTALSAAQRVWVVPAMVLNNRSFTQQMERWIQAGGHLILLVEYADSQTNDWGTMPSRYEPNEALSAMLLKNRLVIKPGQKGQAEKIRFKGTVFAVNASSPSAVVFRDQKPSVFATTRSGQGRISILTDGRLFRNRWIGEKDHASLLAALIGQDNETGSVVFLRGSVMSLWGMLRTHFSSVLIALAVFLCLWLWKNFARFGPVETPTEASTLRGYEHHLEALGDFQWRLDRGQALLAPMRTQMLERGQHLHARSGQQADLFQLLADRAALSRDRVLRAMAEVAPADAASFIRTMADLQLLLKAIH